MSKFTIALDFDGTCVSHRYPNIGEEAPKCVETLKKWVDKYNVGLILNTMRSKKELDQAIQWFKNREIPLYGIQKDPHQEEWTDSPKCHANISIDDRNIGCPLKTDSEGIGMVVDWKKINTMVEPILRDYRE